MEREKSEREIQVNRIEYLDSLRGFAILLVIIGHIIQFNYTKGGENIIFNIIYSFHMPLFFFLSGCTRSIHEEYKGELSSLKDFYRESCGVFLKLIVPSIFWTLVIPLFFNDSFVIDGKISRFWFLNTLFSISIIWMLYSFIGNYLKGKKILLLFLLISIIILFVLDIKRISLMYLIMYIIGYYTQKYKGVNKINKWFISLLALTFLLLVGSFDYLKNGTESAERVWMEFPLSIMASLTLLKVFFSLGSNVFTKSLAFLGKFTLGIYLCHFYFIRDIPIRIIESMFGTMPQLVILFFIAILVAYICVFIQKIIETLPLISELMYGVNLKLKK